MGGGRRLKAMIGAYDFLGSEKDRELQFKWKAKARNGANAITISLDPSDTYTLKFWKIRAGKVTKIEEMEGVYDDMLRSIFEDRTGLYLRM